MMNMIFDMIGESIPYLSIQADMRDKDDNGIILDEEYLNDLLQLASYMHSKGRDYDVIFAEEPFVHHSNLRKKLEG